MQFSKVEPNENYSVARFVSETGQWEMGMQQVLFGVRVAAGRVGSCCYSINYCAGADLGFLLQLFIVIQGILETFPEETTAAEIEQIFPDYDVKPISKDPCWPKLQELLNERAGVCHA